MSKPSARPHWTSPPQTRAVPSLVFNSGDPNPLHLDRTKLNLKFHVKEKNKSVAGSATHSTEKQHLKKEKNRHHNIGIKPNNGQDKRIGRKHVRKLSARQTIVAPYHTRSTPLHAVPKPSSQRASPKVHQDIGKCKRQSPGPTRCQPMLIPKEQTGQNSRRVEDRTKSPRLNGADLYVVKLCWRPAPDVCCEQPGGETKIVASPRPFTGSLHDELNNPEPKRPTRTKHPPTLLPKEKRPTAVASRPCHRCISYMASVGIKRVFWTDDKGDWEGAKIRDLVDVPDNLGSQEPSDASAALNSVFVTKHEVLMLRRMMGDS
ncbi:hypothetical protein G6011_11423 [Alternaria panax]|uniref:Uncharacterized protein n=1 Tax=Alternaria panax TaxID=48097 RepID=A0AAD4IDU9_9PLEO|nr:hypothetical protein G6011_11423 [Alternaria panax]